MDVFKCISDVTSLKTEIQTFLAQNVTVEALIAEFQKLEPLFEQALSDCGIANVSISNLINPGTEKIPVSFDFLRCLQDLNAIADLLASTLADITSGNVVNVLQDLVELKSNVELLADDCTSNTSVSLGRGRVLAVNNDQSVLDCLSDIENLASDLEKFVTVAQSGDISAIIAQLNVVVNDAKVVLNDCQLTVYPGFQALKLRLDTLNPVECLGDLNDLVNLANTIIQNFNNSQYEQLVENLVQFVDKVQQTIADCSGSNVTLSEMKTVVVAEEKNIECLGEMNQATIKLTELSKSPKNEFLMRLDIVFAQFRKTFEICDVKCPVLNRIVKIDPFACIQDIESLVGLVQQTINDTESFDISAVISDVEQLVSLAETAVADCTGANVSVSTQKLTMDIFQCVNDIEFEVSELNALASSLAAGNISDVLPRISTIIQGVDTLLADCGLNSTIEEFGKKLHFRPEECLNDVEAVVSAVDQVIADFQAKNWQQLIEDLFSAVQQVQQLAADCFNYNLTRIVSGSCLEEVEQVAEDVVAVVQRIGNSSGSFEDIVGIIEQITNVVGEVQDLENACGLNVTALVENRNNNIVFVALGQSLQGNTCWESVQVLGNAILELTSGGDALAKLEKIMKIKELINDLKSQCLGIKSQEVSESVVSYVVQAKGLRI